MEEKRVRGRVSFNSIKYRLNPRPRRVRRYTTGISSFDEWTGGLPYGLTVIYGGAGCGKSLLSRSIAINSKHALYFCCEVLTDAPPHDKYPNVDTVDYTTYLPNYKRALEEMDVFIEELKPDLVVIDSLTSFLSVTRKALPESDLRSGIAYIHTKYDGKVPIIGISEVRGTGFGQTTAGGEGVKHGCSMLIEMSHIFLDYNSIAEAVNGEIGEDVYLFRVVKDKHNLANHSRARVYLDDKGIPYLVPIKKVKANRVWSGI